MSKATGNRGATTPAQPATTPAQPATTPAQPATTPAQPATTPAQPATTPAQAAGAEPAASGSATPASSASGSAASAQPAPEPATPAASLSAVKTAATATAAGEVVPEPSAIVRAGGIVVSIVFAFVSAIFELLLSTLRAGDFVTIWKGDPIGSGSGPLIPIAVVLAVVGNVGLAWFAVGTTGRRWALGPPWALWTIVMLIAAGVRTHEGDYLLNGTNYVALAMILIGSLTFAVYTYRMILQRIPPAPGSTSGKRLN